MNKPILVLGGGIAGIQAALDLAKMNVPVFLVEERPSLGGRMAQLDKTFPTNDCSACILAPKVTAAYNHPFIKTFTYSALEGLVGEAPNFTAHIRKKARFIDEEACKGCNACIAQCPVSAKSEFEEGITDRRAVYKPFAQAVPNIVSIDKKGTAPCKLACPAHLDAAGIAALAGAERWREALSLIRRVTPFAGTLGQLCSRPCEAGCYRQYADAPISIASLEGAAAAYERISGKRDILPKAAPAAGKKIAILGSGPAAMNCAYRLALMGVEAVVFEHDAQACGILRGQLDADSEAQALLENELQVIQAMGVEILCGMDTENRTQQDWAAQGFDGLLRTNTRQVLFTTFSSSEGDAQTLEYEGVPSDLIEAIAAGNRWAVHICNHLMNTQRPLAPILFPAPPLKQVPMPLKGAGRTGIQRTASSDLRAAHAEAQRCLNCAICGECRACEIVCPPKAICHEQEDQLFILDVAGVILATGYETVKDIPDGYGYGRYPNVVTAMEYERMLSASGPLKGHVQRPSDGRAPKRIAFIQCVGSRDTGCDRPYCSAVCCMYAVKEAIITKEHLSGIEALDIYLMDLRAYGKEFDRYADTAREKHGTRFIQSRVAEIIEDAATGKLVLKHSSSDGSRRSEGYDLVVLSVGLKAQEETRTLARSLGLKTDRHGFGWKQALRAPDTSRPGIYACGAFSGPKDIPETVVEAGAAAAAAARNSRTGAVSEEMIRTYFPLPEPQRLRDVSNQALRIGVFVCHCGTNIAGFLDVKEVASYAKTLPYVAFARDYLYACSVNTQKTIADIIIRQGLNRVVIASCSPRTHEPLFQEILEKAGLNSGLVRMANIRDQCSWVHMDAYEAATDKAKDLVRMAVGGVLQARPLTRRQIPVTKGALVLGGGMAGLTAALSLAEMGVPVHLVEKTESLGGHAVKLADSAAGRSYGAAVQTVIGQVLSHPDITVHTQARVMQTDGYVGNFASKIQSGGEVHGISHGVVLVAIGAMEAEVKGYSYGAHPGILTLMELEDRIRAGSLLPIPGNTLVMIQCAGSREPEYPCCSRVCCNQAIRNAQRLKALRPELNIMVLYRDIRAYGLHEAEYAKARQAGILFLRYPDAEKPKVSIAGDRLQAALYDPVLQESLVVEAGMVVLSGGIAADREENRIVAQMLKLPLNQDGFFLEAHAKLRPVEFATEGVFLCGLAHGPKDLEESLIQSRAAAAKAAAVLMQDVLETEGITAFVAERDCSGCGTCVQVCAYKAAELVTNPRGAVKKAFINPILCKGCGTCAAACRCGAIDVCGFSDRQVLNELEQLFRF